MDKNKKGKPFTFPDSFILVIGYIRTSFHPPYGRTEGIVKATGKRLLPTNPSYGHICKRINKLTINIKKYNTDDEEYILITVDSTGIKTTNKASDWTNEKWDVQNRKGRLSQDPRCCKHKDKGNP
jgi:hypothetical protein